MSLIQKVTRAAVVALALGAGLASAADSEETAAVSGPEVLLPTHRDVSPALREILPRPARPSGLNVEVNPILPPPRPPRPPRPELPEEPDAGLQTDERPFPLAASTPPPLLSVPGLSDDDNAVVAGTRIVPPDTEGDIGPNHYVQWINLILAVWDVSRDADGTPTSASLDTTFGIRAGNSIWNGFGGFCQTNNDGDPIVLYDHLADRWLLSQFSIDEGVQCIAISTGPDPTGTYFRYAYTVTPGGQNDYPKFGLMPEAYYLSLRDFPAIGTFSGALAFDRLALLDGAASPVAVKFSLPCTGNNCPDGIQPPHLEGPAPPFSTPGIFNRTWDDTVDGPLTGFDCYRLWEFDPDFTTPGNSTFTELPCVPATTFDRTLPSVPQDSSTQLLDPLSSLQMYRAQYRHFAGSHDSIVLNTTVDAGGDRAGIRWAELRNAGAGWMLHQDGTYAPADGLYRWMGSAAMDADGNIALGFSVSSSSLDPSIRYTSRLAGDPAGTLPGGEVTLSAGAGAQTGSSRWGDYSTMSVDPADGCAFWYTQEYYENTESFDFKTRIGAFRLPACGAEPSVDITMPADGSEFDGSTSILFVGTATDPLDGDLGSSLSWASSVDGAIGSGDSFSTTLSTGLHTIEASVANSLGRPGSGQIGLTITAPGCPAHLDVGPGTISGAQTLRSVATIEVLGGTVVDATADLEFVTSQSVAFQADLALDAGARLSVVLTDTPCP